jgi:hypothetical protein
MAKILITIVSYNKKDRYKTKKDAMEISCKKMCIILSALIINQQIFCMELISCAKQCVVKRLYDETEFGKFSQLPLDTQRTIFKHSHNKTNFQHTNKSWYTNGSIQSVNLFHNNDKKDCCGLSKKHISRIILCAAYNKNYKGVENILENSNFLDIVKDKFTYFCIDKYYLLHLQGIAKYNNDHTLKKLCTKYQIPDPEELVCRPTDLIMYCLAGSSDAITHSTNYSDIQNALKIAIDCDHAKCIKALLTKTVINDDFHKYINNGIILRALNYNNLTVLETLLTMKCFDINKKICFQTNSKKTIDITLFDHVLSLAQKDQAYNSTVSLFKKYGAKTIEEVGIKNKNEERFFI